MSVKSSQVLRLAAEYALDGQYFPVMKAQVKLNATLNKPWHLEFGLYGRHIKTAKDECIALCLAAAIAEDEGD